MTQSTTRFGAGMTPGAAAGALDGVAAGVAMETLYRVECRDARGRLKWIEHARNRVVTAGLNKLLDATFKTGLASPAWYIGLVGAAYTDGAMTSGAAYLTSASSGFTAAEAGRAIIVRGAAAAAADLVTTVAAYNGAGNVTLGANAGTSVTGAPFLFDGRAADTMAAHTPWSELTAYSQATRPAFTGGTISGGSIDNSASQAQFSINANNTLIGGLFLCDSSAKSGATGNLYGMAPFTGAGFRQMQNGDTLNVTATLTAAAQ